MTHQNTDEEGKRFGMWIFLYSEILLFGAIFVLYAAYFWKYHKDFIESSNHLDLFYGTLNTIILLFGSYLVAASITAVRRQQKKTAVICLFVTICTAALFIFNKYREWSHEFHLGRIPGSEVMQHESSGTNLFFSLYYLTTGLHGLHVIIGASVLAVSLGFLIKDKIDHKRFVFLENAGLYWHLVDLIWVFVFPLYYLAR